MKQCRKRILIVEDDGWTRYALARIFGHHDVMTVTASNLSEGLAFLDQRPDCIILDLNLPDGCGEAILLAVREQGLSCRVVVCSVIADDARLQGLARLAPDAVLLKPCAFEDLAKACGL